MKREAGEIAELISRLEQVCITRKRPVHRLAVRLDLLRLPELLAPKRELTVAMPPHKPLLLQLIYELLG
jgi:hypothetical protein